MASGQGNRPAQHTGNLGAPGTTGAVQTHDPLGAPGSTGASPTTPTAGYDVAGQGQLHRVPLQGKDTTYGTGQGYAYGTAASIGQAGHAGVYVPHTTGVQDTAHTGEKKSSDVGRTGGIGQKAHEEKRGGGYDTGSLGGGIDIGRGHEEKRGGGYDTGRDKGDTGEIGIGQRGHQGGGYDWGGGQPHTQGLGVQGGGYDTGHDSSGDKTGQQGVGSHGGSYDTGLGGRTHGQDLGAKDHGGVQDASGDKTKAHGQGVGSLGVGYDAGLGGRAHGQDLGVGDWGRSESSGYDTSDKTHVEGLQGYGGGYDTSRDKTREQGVREHGGGYEFGGHKDLRRQGENRDRGYDDMPRAGDEAIGGVSTTYVEVVQEEPIYEEESKGIIDKLMERIP